MVGSLHYEASPVPVPLPPKTSLETGYQPHFLGEMPVVFPQDTGPEDLWQPNDGAISGPMAYNVKVERNQDDILIPRKRKREYPGFSNAPYEELFSGQFIQSRQFVPPFVQPLELKLNALRTDRHPGKRHYIVSNIPKPKSPYVGVSWHAATKKWLATISVRKKKQYIGTYDSDEEAAKAVNFRCCELMIPMKNPGLGIRTPTNSTELRRLKQENISLKQKLADLTFEVEKLRKQKFGWRVKKEPPKR